MSTTYGIATLSFWLTLLNICDAFPATIGSSSDLSDTLPSLIKTTETSILLANRLIDWSCQGCPQRSGSYARSYFDALR